MDESINTTNKKQNCQKPPLSIVRITGEMLIGMVIGITVAAAVPFSSPILHILFEGMPEGGFADEFAAFRFLGLGVNVLLFLIVYGPVAVVGVYLVGKIGQQTGSFLATLTGGLVGAFVIFIPLFILFISEEVILYLPLLLIPPIIATVGFNLTRRYK